MAAPQKKIIVTCAITGAIHTPSMSPYLHPSFTCMRATLKMGAPRKTRLCFASFCRKSPSARMPSST